MSRKASRLDTPKGVRSSRPLKNSELTALFDDPTRAFAGMVSDRIVMKPTSELKLSRHRTRTHDEAQLALMCGSFQRFGFINPIICDEAGEVLAGAARYEVARRLKIDRVPTVLVTHLNEDEKRAYQLADNRIAELAGWDTEALRIEFEHLIEINFDVGVLGFTTPEIDIVLAGGTALSSSADPTCEDGLVDVDGSKAAITRKGDLFRLGKHLFVCADATQPSSYEPLMGADRARLVLSDPPYNCAIDGFVGGLGKVRHRDFAMAAGEMSDEAFTTFLVRYYENSGRWLVNGGLLYTFMDWRQQYLLQTAAKIVGLRQLNLCVWNKCTGGMGSFYRSQHELCLVHKLGDAPHLNLVELGRNGRYRTNVWDHQGMAGFSRDRDELLRAHPTVKPWALLAEAIKDCTHHGDIVLDPFLGSGSTLIAAEKTGRCCRGIELDPLYCDVIIRRYEKATGQPAVHVESGMTFAVLAEARSAAATALQSADDKTRPVLLAAGTPAGARLASDCLSDSAAGGVHA